MIQDVQELGAELQFQTLFDREILEQRVIDVEQARPMQKVAARVAIDVDVLRWKGVRRCIDTVGQVTVSAVRAGRVNQVGPSRAAGGGIGSVNRAGDIERQPRLRDEERIHLPRPERASQKGVCGVEDRDFVNHAARQAVADVPVGVGIVGAPVIRVHRRAAAIRIGGDVLRMRPGVAAAEQQAAGHALAHDHAQALVVGDLVILNRADHVE